MSDQLFRIIICAGLILTLILKIAAKDKRPIIGALLSILPGLLALCVINLFSPLTGVALPVSRLSVSASALLGIPGVTAMLLIQALF